MTGRIYLSGYVSVSRFPFSFTSVVSYILIYVQSYPVSIFSADSEDWAVCVISMVVTINNNPKKLVVANQCWVSHSE